MENDLKKVSSNIKHINAETTRKIKELNEARTAQRVRQSQIVRLASLSRPVDQDTTYFIADRHVASARENVVDEPESFEKKYIKIAKSGELVQLEARLVEATAAVQRSFIALDDKLSSEKGGKSSAFVSTSQRHKKAELLLSTVEKLELQNFYLVKEYLKLRLNIMTVQREEAEAREDLEKTRESYVEMEAALKRQLTVGINSIKSKYDKDMKMLQHQLDRQLIAIAEKGQEVQQARERLLAHSSSQEKGLKNNVNLLASRCGRHKNMCWLRLMNSIFFPSQV